MASKGSDSKTSRYSQGERILCFHGPLIYDAKCLKVRKGKDGTFEYLVHYAGWKKSWDEWVSDVRILKYNEQNLIRQREIANFYKNAKKVRCKVSLSAASSECAATAIAEDGNLFNYRYIDTTVTDEDSRPSTPGSDKTLGSQSGESETGNVSVRSKKRHDTESNSQSSEGDAVNTSNTSLRPKRRRDGDTSEASNGKSCDNETGTTSLRSKRRRDTETTDASNNSSNDNEASKAKKTQDTESGELSNNATGDKEVSNLSLRPKRRRDTVVVEPSSSQSGESEVGISSKLRTRRETETAEPSNTQTGDNEGSGVCLRPKRRRDTEIGESSSSQSGESEESNLSVKKIKKEPGVQTEEQFLEKVEIKVKIPDELKPWLVDDWDLICRQKKLYLLPAKTTIDTIIDNYIQMKTSNYKNLPGPFKESASMQTAIGLKEYFNATLGSQLLYNYERTQYNQILEKYPNQLMSSIYGAAHLLRLFIILGGLIVYTQINEKTVQVLKCQLQDFLKYLLKNSSTLFSTQFYEYATPEYHRMSASE